MLCRLYLYFGDVGFISPVEPGEDGQVCWDEVQDSHHHSHQAGDNTLPRLGRFYDCHCHNLVHYDVQCEILVGN